RRGADANQTVPTSSQSPSRPAPGSGDGERPSWGHNAPCSHSENPTAVLFLITHEPRVCANPLHNSTRQPQ
ncbi:Chromosomal replication initiator protein DnaA, partial [Dissostichus eleginoides]